MITETLLALVLAGPGVGANDTIPLAEVLESALRTNPAMAGAEARLTAAEASTGEARAAWLPTVSATALANRYQEPMVVAPLHGFDITAPPQFESTLYQGHALAQYTLFDGGARSARIRVAEARAASAESGVTAARDGVLAEATSAYLSVLSAVDVLRAHDRWLTALQEEQDRATLLFEQGKTARVAVLRAQASLSRARAEREAADEGLRLAIRRLSRVSGIDAIRIDSAGLVPVSVRPEPLPDRDALVERARSSNPALAQAASRVTATETGVAAAKSSYLPRVSLSGQYNAFGAPGVDLTTEWQAGVQLSYPLFTGGARGAGVDRARAEAAAARSDRQQAEQQVADAVDAALVAYRSAQARVAALEAAVEQSAEVARIEALALESGAGVQTDYLRAEAQLVEARSGLAEARHSQAQARVRLAQATGTLTMEWLAQMTEEVER